MNARSHAKGRSASKTTVNDVTAADDLAPPSHLVCPYSHSIHGNLEVTTNVHIWFSAVKSRIE
jgi:organic hydroperoxide reductase OsmC/OhrA